LTITDDKGATGTISQTITTVANILPTATINVLSTFGYAVNVEAVGIDTDGEVMYYQWNWG
jgi:hypothetical protein